MNRYARRAFAAVVAFVAVTVSPLAAKDDPPAIEYTPNFVKPKAILQVPPVYPRRAAYAGKEGWVLMRYSIETDGSVSEVEVVDSSDYRGVFSTAAVTALKEWRYATPTLDGKPARKCNNRQLITFKFQEATGGRPSFARKNRVILEHIKGERFDEAERLIMEAHESEGLNLYEIDRLFLLEGVLNQTRGNDIAAMRAYSRAISGGGGHLTKDESIFVLRTLFALELNAERFTAAMRSFEMLKDWESPSDDDPISKAAAAIEGMKTSGSPFAVDARIENNPNATPDHSFFDYEPLRREIGITDVSGSIDKLTIACDATTATIVFEEGWSWKAPNSWGACSVFVYGTPGTTFKIVEY